ncbi:hypothetical protein HDU76_014020, partial [Blyttiomyces sp. JEL0837]
PFKKQTISSTTPSTTTTCTLRGKIWKCLIGVYKISALEYTTLISLGPSQHYAKIKNDTFRTMATDEMFLKRVSEGSLRRVLNAFVWKVDNNTKTSGKKGGGGGNGGQGSGSLVNLRFSYVQGMNPALEGVHCGVKLFDRCLKLVDPELHGFLKVRKLDPVTYAFPSIMTFCACTPPLSELLRIWDFLLAYGIHLNILCVLAQLIMMREAIMTSNSPGKLLRTFPDLNAKSIITLTLRILPLLPEGLYDMLVRHPFDPMINDFVLPETMEGEEDE